MDIKAAFDTVKQDKMLEVVSALLDQVGAYLPKMHWKKLTNETGPRLLLNALLPPPSSGQQSVSRFR